MLAVRSADNVSGLGAFVTAAVPCGAIVDTEHARFLSAPLADISATRHNDRYAWSVVDSVLPAYRAPRALEMLVAELERACFARGLGELAWDSVGDAGALQFLARAHGQTPELVRALYDFMATNILLAQLKIVHLRLAGHAEPVATLMPEHWGFFTRLSRVNHACEPSANVEQSVAPAVPALTLRALRDLCADDEVTINYLGNNTNSERGAGATRLALLREFGFRCACARCRGLCAWLACSAPGTKRCPCQRAAYCGREHQKLDWARHRADAHAMSRE